MTSIAGKFQAGADGVMHQGNAGRPIGGLSVKYGTLGADVGAVLGQGANSTTGYGLGGMLTWYGSGGYYLDGQTRVIW